MAPDDRTVVSVRVERSRGTPQARVAEGHLDFKRSERVKRRRPPSLPVPNGAQMARKFLYLIAVVIFLILGVGLAYQFAPGWFARTALVPSAEFVEQTAAAPNAYDDPK